MNGEKAPNSDQNEWSKSFENLVLFIFKVEWLTPVGKINFVCTIGVLIIFIIIALRGMVQNTTLNYLFAFVVLFIMSVSMSSRSYVAKKQNKLEKL